MFRRPFWSNMTEMFYLFFKYEYQCDKATRKKTMYNFYTLYYSVYVANTRYKWYNFRQDMILRLMLNISNKWEYVHYASFVMVLKPTCPLGLPGMPSLILWSLVCQCMAQHWISNRQAHRDFRCKYWISHDMYVQVMPKKMWVYNQHSIHNKCFIGFKSVESKKK